LPSNFAERRLLRVRVCVQRVLTFLRWRGRTIIFLRAVILPGFDDCLIFRSQDALALEIFLRVNMLGVLPQFLLAGAFLARGIGDTLIRIVLCAGDICTECRATDKHSYRNVKAD